MKKELNTEQKIIRAASTNFLKMGFAGARMQDIANEAGINKAMLHYYFRNKQQLFETVFQEKANQLFGNVLNSISPQTDLEGMISSFIEEYLTFLSKNSELPLFVINEISRHPGLIEKVFLPSIQTIALRFKELLQQGIDAGRLRPIPFHHLLMNMISMCVFPILAKPILSKFLTSTGQDFQDLINERKQIITQCILNDLKLQ